MKRWGKLMLNGWMLPLFAASHRSCAMIEQAMSNAATSWAAVSGVWL